MKQVLNLSDFSEQPLSTQVLLGLLKGYSRPYDKIVEMVHEGSLYQLRKGLYVTTSLISPKTPELFLIANHLYGPSYVSIDSAMFHWGLIPERVYEVTSASTKKSKVFRVQNTTFSYTQLPIGYYPLGIQSVALTENQMVLMASPEKAICDKVITTPGINLRSKTQALSYLVEDLRIEIEGLKELNLKEMFNWLPVCPKKKSIQILIESLATL